MFLEDEAEVLRDMEAEDELEAENTEELEPSEALGDVDAVEPLEGQTTVDTKPLEQVVMDVEPDIFEEPAFWNDLEVELMDQFEPLEPEKLDAEAEEAEPAW